jgi:hypothetical protein
MEKGGKQWGWGRLAFCVVFDEGLSNVRGRYLLYRPPDARTIYSALKVPHGVHFRHSLLFALCVKVLPLLPWPRSEDDERQIARGNQVMGPTGCFRTQLTEQVAHRKTRNGLLRRMTRKR